MRIRIVSDGTGIGTKVTDERGVPLEMVQKIEWEIPSPQTLATARITFLRVPVDLVGEAETHLAEDE